jgi:hypothetical protein
VVEDAGIQDKRLLVVEPELGSTLRVIGREGNTLSPVIRQAWDTGALCSMTKNSPAKSTGAHVTIIGHITRAEVSKLLNRTEIANGFANRFLWVCVRRSKILPDGGRINEADFGDYNQRLMAAVSHAQNVGELKRDPAARELWHRVYEELSEGRPGLLGSVTSRGEAQVMRLACIYAVLDRADEIQLPHLQAALEVWRYCESSARYIFGDDLGDGVADRILSALREAPSGCTRDEIRNLFQRHRKSPEINRALELLTRLKLVYRKTEKTGGRPAERWFAVGIECAESAVSAEKPDLGTQ